MGWSISDFLDGKFSIYCARKSDSIEFLDFFSENYPHIIGRRIFDAAEGVAYHCDSPQVLFQSPHGNPGWYVKNGYCSEEIEWQEFQESNQELQDCDLSTFLDIIS